MKMIKLDMETIKMMNLVELQKAIENFDGNRLYVIEEGNVCTVRYDFYPTEAGIEVWTETKVNVTNKWYEPELECIYTWEEIPEAYKAKLGAK